MNPNLRFTLSVLSGILAGVVIVATVEAIGHFFFPPPSDFELNTICEHLKTAPVMALIFPLIAWATGALIAGVVAKLVYRTNNKPAFIAGLVHLVFVLINLIVIGCHPLWLEIMGALLPVPMAMLGSRLVATV